MNLFNFITFSLRQFSVSVLTNQVKYAITRKTKQQTIKFFFKDEFKKHFLMILNCIIILPLITLKLSIYISLLRKWLFVFVAHVDGKKQSVLISSSAHQTGDTSRQCSVSRNVIFGLPFGLESSGTDGTFPGRTVQLLQVVLVFVLGFRFDFDFNNFCKNNSNKLLSGEML